MDAKLIFKELVQMAWDDFSKYKEEIEQVLQRQGGFEPVKLTLTIDESKKANYFKLSVDTNFVQDRVKSKQVKDFNPDPDQPDLFGTPAAESRDDEVNSPEGEVAEADLVEEQRKLPPPPEEKDDQQAEDPLALKEGQVCNVTYVDAEKEETATHKTVVYEGLADGHLFFEDPSTGLFSFPEGDLIEMVLVKKTEDDQSEEEKF